MTTDQSDWIQYIQYQKLSVCITFHYVPSRLKYLAMACKKLVDIAPKIHLTIVTNTSSPEELQHIRDVIETPKFIFDILIPIGLGHPFLLAWSHLPVFKKQFEDKSFTHFLYLEDDIGISPENIKYWLEERTTLKPFGFYPSFFRRELNDTDNSWYSTDVMSKMSLYDCPVVDIEDGKSFISTVFPYQGMYFLDRELMKEHLEGPSSNPDFEHNRTGIFRIHPTEVREKAALALTYVNVPAGYRSRNLLSFDKKANQISDYCMIHHLPNNYTNNPESMIGKIKVDQLFIPKSINTYFRKKIKVALSSLLSALFSLKT